MQKDLCQEKYLIPSDEDCERKIGCDARAKLQNRLTLQEYVCYLTKKLVRNLDAYGRAKAAPKTKSYLDALGFATMLAKIIVTCECHVSCIFEPC